MNQKLAEWGQFAQALGQKDPERLLSRAVTLIALTLLIVFLFSSFKDWRQLLEPIKVPAKASQPFLNKEPAVTVEQLVAWHLFGEQGKEAAIEVSLEEDDLLNAPTTELNLLLKGVYTSSVSGRGSAIIANAEGDEGVYRVGARLPGPAELKEVLDDRVLIEHNGRIETLWLYEPEEIENLLQPVNGGTKSGSELDDRRKDKTATKLLLNYRELLRTEPLRLAEVVNFTPVMQGAEMRGVRIAPVRRRADFYRLGLQPNDVVMSVNKVELNSIDESMTLFQGLQDSQALELQVQREGREVTLLYSLERQ